MARNIVRSACEALALGPSPATGDHFSSGNSGVNQINSLYRIQSYNLDVNISRTDINELGRLSRIGSIITESPTVNGSFSYILTNMLNENSLGFVRDGTASCISGFLSKATDERNIFFLQVPEGSDAAGYVGAYSNRKGFAVGNAFFSNYTVNGAVGSPPNVSVDFEGLNFRIYSNMSGQPLPSISGVNGVDVVGKTFTFPSHTTGVAGQLDALLPGDITLDLGSSILGTDLSDAKIQDFTITIPLSRENLNKLGNKFAYSKELTFPLTTTLTINGDMGDLTTGSLSQILCQDTTYDNLTINLRRPTCDGSLSNIQCRYVLKGAKLDSVNRSQTVNGRQSFSATWSTQIGSPESTDVGVFMSGALI